MVPQPLAANGAGTGNGGSISVVTSGITGDITAASGSGFQFTATGGSAGSSSGNGGSITVSAGRNLSIQSGATINASVLGTNGNGGSVTLAAGTAAVGTLQVNQGINTNGVGTGNGGIVNITYADPSNAFVVGATGANSFISGNITADAVGAGGIGGTVTINNLAVGPLNVTLTGNISAHATTTANLEKSKLCA